MSSAAVGQGSSDVRYATALASLKLLGESQVLDMSSDDFEFFIAPKLWVATDRSRARRCVEAAIYGSLDFCGYPRFAVPAEFVAAAIAYYVHPVNIQTACLIMEGAEFSENIINGMERPLRANEIFAHVLRVRGGHEFHVATAEDSVRIMFKMGA